MPISLSCPGCKAVFDVPEELAGKTIRCTTCKATIVVPAAGPVIVEAKSRPAPLPFDDEEPPRPSARRRPVRDEDEDDEDRKPERRPRGKSSRKSSSSGSNVFLMLGGGLVALVLLGGGAYGLYALLGGKKGPTPGGDGGVAAAAAGWVEVTDANAYGFTVRMPGKPVTQAAPGAAFGRGARTASFIHSVGNDEEGYGAIVIEFPRGISPDQIKTQMTTMEKQMRQVLSSGPSKREVKIEDGTDFSQNGYSGREFRFTAKGIRLGAGLFRMVSTERRIFVLFCAGDSFTSSSPKLRMFFDSFSITAKPEEPKSETPPKTANANPARPSGPPGLTPPAPASPNPGMPAADEWQPVANAEGFALEMPGPAQRDVGKMGTGKGHWVLQRPGEVFSLSAGTMLTQKGPKEALEVAGESLLKEPGNDAEGMGLKPTGSTDIMLGGVPGKQYTFVSTENKNQAVVRLFLAGTRRYSVLVAGPDLGPDNERAKRFLDSFRITDLAPTGVATMPNPFGPGGRPLFQPPMPPGNGPGDPANPTPPVPQGPPVKLTARLDPFWAIAFAPAKNEVFTVGGRMIGTAAVPKPAGVLRRYSYPDFKLKGSYQLPNLASKAAFDEKTGLLYLAALTKAETLLRQKVDYDRAYGDGLIQIFDLNPVLAGQTTEGQELKPAGTITPSGKPVAIELSEDGQKLFCLSEFEMKGAKRPYQAKLYQIDTEKKAVAKEMALPEPTRDMSWSADGKRLYLTEWPVGVNNRPIPGKTAGVVVVDPDAWTKLPTLSLPGLTMDLTASPAGPLVATVSNGRVMKLLNVDPNGGKFEEIKAAIGGSSSNGYARFSPDGKRLVVSSVWMQGGVDVYDVAGTEFRRVLAVLPNDSLPLTGHFRLSPDGTIAVFRTGAVLDVANLEK